MNGKELHELWGAYLLGGLDDADQTRFEDHLQHCAMCRSALEDLQSLPGLLTAVDERTLRAGARQAQGENRRVVHK